MERTLAELQARLEQFRDERDWKQFHTPKDLAAAIGIEAAELQELFLWRSGDAQARILDDRRGDLEAELADVMIQCLNFASVANIDLLAAIERKIDANEQRYPRDQVRGSAEKATPK